MKNVKVYLDYQNKYSKFYCCMFYLICNIIIKCTILCHCYQYKDRLECTVNSIKMSLNTHLIA